MCQPGDPACTPPPEPKPAPTPAPPWAPAVYSGPYYLPESCQGSGRLDALINRTADNFLTTNAFFLNVPALGGTLPFATGLLANAQAARFELLGNKAAAAGMRVAARPFAAFAVGVAIGSAFQASVHALSCEF